MRYLLENKSCKSCLFFEEEDTSWIPMVYPGTACLYLFDAKGLTPKERKKIQKALVRYNSNQSQPYCKFWTATILKSKSHNDIKKRAIEFVESRLEDDKR